MDDSWRSKCSAASPWPPPPTPPPMAPSPLLVSASLTPAAPPHPSPGVPAAGLVGQVGINLNHHFHSFIAQGARLSDPPKFRDAMACKTLKSGSSNLGKLETGNSFLALLSGELPQFSNSKPPQFAKVHTNSNDTFIDPASRRLSSRNVQSLPQNQGAGSFENWNELSCFTASKSCQNSSISRVPSLHLQREGSLQDTSVRLVPQQASQVNTAVFAASSIKHSWTTSVQQENAGKHHRLNVQASQEIPSTSKCSNPYSAPFLRGHPRVFCHDTVGELFMSDMGLFGVVCLCHNSRMSLAKFCEHSGVPRTNPGEVVHLENGMTISDWCKQCLGMVALSDSKRWEGPENLRANDMSTGSKVTRTSSLLDSIVPISINKESGVSEISGKHSNSSAYSGHPQIKAAIEIPGDSMQHSVFQGYNLGGAHNTMHKKPPSLTKFALTKNHSMHEVKQIPVSIDYQKAQSTVHKGKDVTRQQHDNCSVYYRAISSNNSIHYPCPWNKSSTHGHDINADNLSNKASVLNKNGATSINLELRQPSQKSHTFADSFPTSMLQFGTLSSNSQKKLLDKQLNLADNSGEAEKARSSFNFPSGTSCYDHNNVHAVDTVDTVDHPESDTSMHDATKNSLISLFLSHLEGNNTSQSLDGLLNSNEHSLPRMGNGVSISAKHSLRNSTDENETKSKACKLGFPENLDDRKVLQSFDNDNMLSDCTALNNRKTNNRVLTSSINGLCLKGSSFPERSSCSLYEQPSGVLHNPCVRNQHQKAFFISNKDFCDHAGHKSSYKTSTKKDSLSVRSDVSMSSSSATLCSLKPNSSWSNKRTVDMTKDFMDENWKYFAPNHVVEFSKQEKLTASPKRNPESQRLCHLSPMEHQTTAIQRDFAVPVLVREGPQCNSHQNVSEFALRPWPFCRSIPAADRGDASAHRGSSRCCSCTCSTEMVSLGPEHTGKNISTCHICDTDDHQCLRLGRLSDQCIKDDCKQEICEQKEHVSGKYFSPVHSHCVSGCCRTGANNICSAINEQRTCIEAKAKHFIPDCEKDYLLPECKRIRLACILQSNDISSEEMACGLAKPKNVNPDYNKNCSFPDCNKICQDYCDCSKNDSLSRNCHQTPMWRDVPEKDFEHNNSSLANRITQAIETMKVVDDQFTESPGKHFNGTVQESQLIGAQQMSNVSSGSSVPVITEVSVENNNAISQAPNNKVVNDFIVDEGSGIEKCDSSDEAHGSRGYGEVTAFSGKAGSAKSKFQCFQTDLSGNTGDEHSKSQSKCKRDTNLKVGECPSEENSSQWQKFGRMSEVSKRNDSVRWYKSNVLDSDFAASHPQFSGSIAQSKIHFSPSEGIEVDGQHNNLMQKLDSLACQSSSVKRKRSVFSSNKSNFIARLDNQNKVSEFDEMQTRGDHCSIGRLKNTSGKRRMQDLAAFSKEIDAADAGKPPKYASLNCILNAPSCKTTLHKKTKPVVCGNSGIIFNKGNVGQEKPAKILSLSVFLKKARRCSITDICKNSEPAISSDTKGASLTANNREGDASFFWKSPPENEASNQILEVDSNPGILHSSGEVQGSPSKKEGFTHNPPAVASQTTCESSPSFKSEMFPKISRTKSRQKYIGVHSSSPTELTKKDRYIMKSSIGTNKSHKGGECQVSELCTGELSRGACSNDTKSNTNSKNHEDHFGKLSHQSRRLSKEKKCFKMISDAPCCVCGSSNQEDVNQLLECSSCLIRAHQACYGVSKIPKGHWRCRPCKTGSKNIICVLCGYDGGAMTRALKSQNTVQSLLKALKMVKVPDSIKSNHSSEIQDPREEHLKSNAVDGSSKSDKSGSVTVISSTCLDASPRSGLEMDLQKHTHTTVLENCIPEYFQFFKSLTAGVFDPCGTHWVHMVCGLWTPGTRCPNVATMSAFDVSGVSPAKKNSICSICNRPGGSCIICRIPNCNITFHPWCAHQKGLLQSEIEGDDADKVGFYGRCLQHANVNSFHPCADITEPEENPGNKEIICARAEGLKGRRREKVFQLTQKPHSRRGECIVSQEQINAWLHINGQKSSARWAGKLPCFDVEHDLRKEYIRYKQSKGWKNFVVYKSGIHGLGLYTSQFIPRGAMVVEYIGEIVGLRVADKREIEYQSGRRIQYKSACYFFRLDKEHIVDATRKGGIARFVNHSCLPNCVAKIISIRNEKKVVFFAERTINPGEEITYDYHFNSEDEGKKIPCFCKSKNCRRYLN